MLIQKIITMANEPVRLRFTAMERSLRAAGCELPLWVIPYDHRRFELPANATWWEIPSLTAWLEEHRAHPVMRKYQCLVEGNYQFVDADVCFLENPEETLSSFTGFVTSCGHWHNPAQTFTAQSQSVMAASSTIWQSQRFNSGQFACDVPLFTQGDLQQALTEPENIETCLRFPFHEQPGLNLLVFRSGAPVTNLTLPPHQMQSTWAGDYPGDYLPYWKKPYRRPYLIHWAGTPMEIRRPINELFYGFLTARERAEWDQQVALSVRRTRAARRSVRHFARTWRNACRAFAAAMYRS